MTKRKYDNIIPICLGTQINRYYKLYAFWDMKKNLFITLGGSQVFSGVGELMSLEKYPYQYQYLISLIEYK